MKDQKRNLNPHAAARVAMLIWGSVYADQKGGSMDFWDTLSSAQKRQCKAEAKKIREARPYTG